MKFPESKKCSLKSLEICQKLYGYRAMHHTYVIIDCQEVEWILKEYLPANRIYAVTEAVGFLLIYNKLCKPEQLNARLWELIKGRCDYENISL